MSRKRRPPVGSRPGTLAIQEDSPFPTIRVIRYTPDTVQEGEVASPQALAELSRADVVTWIDVQGLGDEQTLRELASMFGLHPLVISDVANVFQRPKSEEYDDYQFIVTRMARQSAEGVLDVEQVSLIVGSDYVLTFQERPGDVFDVVRERLRQGKGPMRRSGPDYLAYALLDTVVDAYYPLLEAVGDHLEDLEVEVVANPNESIIHTIYSLKRQLLHVRRAIWPQREMINALIRGDGGFITDSTRLYLRDVYDHCIQIIDVLESYREMAGGLLDVYLSSVSNRMNEVMKVLTIMASVFIPLTFIAGIYGMNFEFMPELHLRWAYPLIWVVMLAVVLGMVWFFWRKGWIAGPKPARDDTDDVA